MTAAAVPSTLTNSPPASPRLSLNIPIVIGAALAGLAIGIAVGIKLGPAPQVRTIERPVTTDTAPAMTPRQEAVAAVREQLEQQRDTHGADEPDTGPQP